MSRIKLAVVDSHNSLDLFKFPSPVVEWTDLSSVQPLGDAVHVEDMRTLSPGYVAIFVDVSHLLEGLALDALVHDVIPTNSTVFYCYVI